MASENYTMDSASQVNKAAGEKVKEKYYNEAIKLYTHAIELDPNNATYYSNRSFCYDKTECYGLAISDANAAIKIDPTMFKAYFRRATANLSIGHLKLALDDFTYLFKLHPNEKSIVDRYKQCSNTYREQQFAKALEYVEKSAFDLIDLESLSFKDTSCELLIEDNKITEEYAVRLIHFLKDRKLLPLRELYKLLVLARSTLVEKKSLVRYVIPDDCRLTVCGDVHGQYYDLCHIFEINGLPSPENNYLFNGDFVDRGSFSVEVITLLLAFQVLYPNHFLLNRGNHETSSMNEVYGFKDEVIKKYNKTVYNLFQELFHCLPVAHLINEQILVIHGGLPIKDGVSLDEIEAISRFKDPPEGSVMFDLLWSDPSPNNGHSPNPRGVSTAFGPDITHAFAKKNNLKYIIRSHESQMEGYSLQHDEKCITIFSAPNYCDEMRNEGAIIRLDKNLIPEFIKFSASPHP